ncbi:MAG: hypothetical protein WC963_03250 [Bacilli bacterium]|jgi:hypothetical protein
MFDILWLQHNLIITKSANKTTQKLAMKSGNDTLVVFLVKKQRSIPKKQKNLKFWESSAKIVLGVER